MTEFDIGLQMACYLAMGVWLRKRGLVDHAFTNGFSRLIFNLCLPFVVLNAMRGEVTSEQIAGIPWVLLAVVVYLAIAFLAAALMVRGRDGYAMSMRVGTVITNFTFMGFPVIQALYGTEGLFYISLISIPMRILLYCFLPLFYADKNARRDKFAWLKSLAAPPMLAIPIGLALGALRAYVPGWLDSVISNMSSTCMPLGMLLSGMLIAEVPVRDLFSDKRLPLAIAMRNLIVPGLTLLALMFLPIQPLVRNVTVIFAALPCGSILSVYAANYNKAPALTALTIMATTLLSIVTIPLWAWVLTLL